LPEGLTVTLRPNDMPEGLTHRKRGAVEGRECEYADFQLNSNFRKCKINQHTKSTHQILFVEDCGLVPWTLAMPEINKDENQTVIFRSRWTE